MSWTKVLGAGIVAGIVVNLVNWVLHGGILGATYGKYPDVFTQTETNPIWFFVVAIAIAIFFTALFAKTRECWAAGARGGMTYGFWLGLVAFFSGFYNPLVIDGFPYFLAWCWGGVNLIGGVVGGTVIGLIIKR